MNPSKRYPELVTAAEHIDECPAEYRQENFEALPIVVKIFQKDKNKRDREEEIDNLRQLLALFDSDVAAISNAFWQGFNKSTKSYSKALQIIRLSHRKCFLMETALLHANFRYIEHKEMQQSTASPLECAKPKDKESKPKKPTKEEEMEKEEEEMKELEKKLIAQRDEMKRNSMEKLSYLWSKSLEYEYTIQLLRQIQCLRDSVPVALEYMNAGYLLHAASVIRQATEIVKEIRQYEFFGTNRLCAAVEETKRKLSVLLCKQLNNIVHGYKRDQKDSLQMQQPQIVAAFASGDREPFHLSFTPVAGIDTQEANDESLSKAPDYDSRKAIWNYVHALVLLNEVDYATAKLKDWIPIEIKKLFPFNQIERAIAICDVQRIDVPQQEQQQEQQQHSTAPKLTPHRSQKLQQSDAMSHDGVRLEDMFERCLDVMKNYQLITEAILFFQGMKSTQCQFTLSDVWVTIQKEILQILKPFLESGRRSSANKQRSEVKTSALFSFSHIIAEKNAASMQSSEDSDSMSLEQRKQDKEMKMKMLQEQTLAVVSNLRNIIVVHPAIMAFNESVNGLLHTQEQSLLHAYVEGLVDYSYIPALKSFLETTVKEIEGKPPDSLTVVPHLSKRILSSVWSVAHFIQIVVQDILALPSSCDKFLKILEELIKGFEKYCEAIVNSKKMPGSFVSDSTGDSLALGLMNKFCVEIPTFLKCDPLWKPIGTVSLEKMDAASLLDFRLGGRDDDASAAPGVIGSGVGGAAASSNAGGGGGGGSSMPKSALASISSLGGADSSSANEIWQFCPDYIRDMSCKIPGSELILDVRKMALLAELHTSMEWLVKELRNTMDAVMKAMSESLDTRPVHIKKAKAKDLQLQKNELIGYGKLYVKRKLQSMYARSRRLLAQSAPLAMTPWRMLREKLSELTNKFAIVSEKSLFTLRLELKLHCVYYLSQCRSTIYCCDESESFPDQAVVELNRHLCSAEDTLVAQLAPERLRFVVDGISPLICDVMISNTKALSRVNRPGIRKMLRNLFTVQQNLTVTIYKKERFFDRVRQYFELMYITDSDELFQEMSNRIAEAGPLGKNLFTREQCNILLALLTPGRGVSATVSHKFEVLLDIGRSMS